MKHRILWATLMAVMLLSTGCSAPEKQTNITATTLPVFTFTQALCEGTPLAVNLLVQENVSCLHDYTLTVKHMKILENADLVVISGGGLEDFLEDVLPEDKLVLDSSLGIELHCSDNTHSHDHSHHHDVDPHFWLSVEHAKQMAHTICDGLKNAYPQYNSQFDKNLVTLNNAFSQLHQYAQAQLASLDCRKLITFHDGFSYMAEGFDLTILHSIEEESGSEASAKDLIAICNLVAEHSLPAVFTEKNGSDSAAKVVCGETEAKLYSLDMAMSGKDYFEAMYHNIDILKEALG